VGALAAEVLRDETKASSVVQSRVWRAFDQFTESSVPRWSGRAGAILNSEGNRAAKAYAEHGAGAAVAAVDDEEWRHYVRTLWLTVVPDAGDLILPYLPVAKISAALTVKAVMSPLVQAAVEWIRANGVREAALLSNTSRKKIAEQIRIGVSKNESAEQIAQRIRKHYKSIRQGRADTIARTEVHAAANYGSLSGAKEADPSLAKIWVDTPDGRTRDAHVGAGGQKRRLNEPFTVDGEKLMHPGDSSMGASAENLANCRCSLFYVAGRRTAPNRPRRAA
jgi:hypothetical protein